jgi:hypothetical protein
MTKGAIPMLQLSAEDGPNREEPSYLSGLVTLRRKGRKGAALLKFQAAAIAARHVLIAESRSVRCV